MGNKDHLSYGIIPKNYIDTFPLTSEKWGLPSCPLSVLCLMTCFHRVEDGRGETTVASQWLGVVYLYILICTVWSNFTNAVSGERV